MPCLTQNGERLGMVDAGSCTVINVMRLVLGIVLWSLCTLPLSNTVKFRKLARPCISPSQTGNGKNRPLNRPSKYKPPGGLYLDN